MSNYTAKIVVSKMRSGDGAANDHKEMTFHTLGKEEASQVEEMLLHSLMDMKQAAKQMVPGSEPEGTVKYALHAHFAIHKSGALFTASSFEWPNVTDESTDVLMGFVQKNLQSLVFFDKLETKG